MISQVVEVVGVSPQRSLADCRRAAHRRLTGKILRAWRLNGEAQVSWQAWAEQVLVRRGRDSVKRCGPGWTLYPPCRQTNVGFGSSQCGVGPAEGHSRLETSEEVGRVMSKTVLESEYRHVLKSVILGTASSPSTAPQTMAAAQQPTSIYGPRRSCFASLTISITRNGIPQNNARL